MLATIGVTRGLGDHNLKVHDSNIYIKPFLSCCPEVGMNVVLHCVLLLTDRMSKQANSPNIKCTDLLDKMRIAIREAGGWTSDGRTQDDLKGSSSVLTTWWIFLFNQTHHSVSCCHFVVNVHQPALLNDAFPSRRPSHMIAGVSRKSNKFSWSLVQHHFLCLFVLNMTHHGRNDQRSLIDCSVHGPFLMDHLLRNPVWEQQSFAG